MTLWGGRFSTKLNQQAWDLNSSLAVDQRLALHDIDGSLAWAQAIHQAGILADKEHASIALGLPSGARSSGRRVARLRAVCRRT